MYTLSYGMYIKLKINFDCLFTSLYKQGQVLWIRESLKAQTKKFMQSTRLIHYLGQNNHTKNVLKKLINIFI